MKRISRRAVLQLLPAAGGAALVGSPSLATASTASTAQTRQAAQFPQPQVRVSDAASRRLATSLHVAYTEQHIPTIGTFRSRTYEGGIPGPTLRVRPGDRMQLRQIQALAANADGAHAEMNVPHAFNTFNLHTHGMHVDPSGDADNTFRRFEPAQHPGDPHPVYTSTIDIPPNHPAGTFWYHPHHHGAATMQVTGGMAGVIIVEGDIDQVPQIAAARDVVVCINELKAADGKVPDLTSMDAVRLIPSSFLVNGAVNPTITLRQGEVQRWRLLNAGGFTVLPLRLQGHTLHQIAQDGITFPRRAETASVSLPMGGRADVLVRAGRPGTYQLVASTMEGKPDSTLMTVVVTASNDAPMGLPDTLPGRPTQLPEPTGRRRLTFKTFMNVFEGGFPHAFRILGTGETPAGDQDGGVRDLRWGRFDPGFVNHTLRLGDVEEWTITNDSEEHSNHPFHLHTNHFLVTSVNGRRLRTPVWHDTITIPPKGEVVFRVRFEDFTGTTMLHCHQLQHEDMGMMQVIKYVS
jgi:FtsP/CotA-like multicopper oxidase with cupredoxin domain